MHKRFGNCRAGWLGGLVLSWMMAAAAYAQPSQKVAPPPDASHGPARAVEAAADTSDWWLGVQCRPVDEALRTHLGLAGAEGLVVEKVVPESPAQKADLKRHDVLVTADGKPLKSPADLIGVVRGKEGKPLVLGYLRGGQKHEVAVAPQHRPEWARVMGPSAMTAEESQLLRKWLQQLQAGEPGEPLRFRFIHPGTILPPDAPAYPPLPPNVSIAITKRGSDLAKVTVTRDDKKWEVAENELDKLPKDLAPYAKCMLGRTVPDAGGAVQLYELMPEGAEPTQDGGVASAQSAPTDKRLEMMNQQLNQLRSLIEELQKERTR
jgi:membrane-associated protease RseP (regulator of RpoE activity)